MEIEKMFPEKNCHIEASTVPKKRVLSPETKAKISAAMKGRIISSEWRAKIGAAQEGEKNHMYGKHPSKETRAKLSAVHKGRHVSEEGKIKRSIALKGRVSPMKGKHLSKEARIKIAIAHTGKYPTGETRIKMSIAKLGKSSPRKGCKVSEETIAKLRASHLGRHPSEETRAKLSAKSKQRWTNPEYKERVVRSMVRASFRRPTMPEKMVTEILNEILPNEYQYVGSGHETVINGCNPDFININGQKKVIEVFGDYYHSPKKTGKSREQEEVDKMNRYREFGFGCLILWEYDIKKHKDTVIKRILAFHCKRHKKIEMQPYLV